MPAGPPITAAELLVRSVRLLFRPPYLTLLAVTLFVSFVSGFVRLEDVASGAATLLLWAVVAYLQIAVILAAAAGAPDDMPSSLVPVEGRPGSADPWIRAALRRRCFVRYLVADLLALMLVTMALLLFVIPGFVVGGIIALAPIVAVLEYGVPMDAISRSAELSRPARRTIGTVFGICVLMPNIGSAAYLLWRGENVNDAVGLAVRATVLILGLIATIALTKAFLALGGAVTPRSARPTIRDPMGRG